MPENDELNNVIPKPAGTQESIDNTPTNEPPSDWFVGRVNNDIPYMSYGDGAEFKDRDSYWEKEEVRNAFMSDEDPPEKAENEAKFRFNQTYDQLSKERSSMALEKYNKENDDSTYYKVGKGLGWITGKDEIDLDKHMSIEKRYARADGATEINGKVFTDRTRDYRELAATSSKVKIGGVMHDIPNLDDIEEKYQAGNKMGLLSDDAVAMKSMLYNPNYLDENGNMLTHFRYPPELSAESRGIDYIEGVGKLSYSDDPTKNDFIKHKNDEIVSFYDYGDRDAMDIEAGAFDFVGRTLNNTAVGFKESFANLQLAVLGAVDGDEETINRIMNDLKSWEGGKVTTALETQEGGFWSMDNVMEQALNVALQLAIGGGAATAAFRGMSAIGASMKAAQIGARVASTTTMSAMAVKDAYKEAIETGYTKQEAGVISLALFGAMIGATSISSIPTAHINKIVGSKPISDVIKSSISMGDDLLAAGSKTAPAVSRISVATKRVKDKVSSMLKKVESKPYLAAALEEGVEETTELALEEAVKNLASGYSLLTKDDPTKGKGRYANIFDEGYWDEKAVEAVMSFSMGAVGGVMAKGGGDIWKLLKKTPEGSKRDIEDYADVIMQGKEKEFLEAVDKKVKKGKLGPADYSTEFDPRTQTYKRMDEFAEGENPLSMAEFNRNVILYQFNMVKSMMKKLGSDKAVDQFRKDNPEFEGKLGGMTIAEDVKKATKEYSDILLNAGDAGENAIITATPKGMTKEEKATWISEQAKLSGLEEGDIERVSDIKREIEDIKSGELSEKYLFQGMTMGTIFDPKSSEYEEKYSKLGEDFFYNLMKASDNSASNQEAAKEMMIQNIKDAAKKAGELNPDLSNIDEALGGAMSEGESLLSNEDINKLQKAYDDYKVDESKIKEMSDEIISSGTINEEYDEDKFISQGASPKEAKFMSALFRKHFNEKVSSAKTTSDLRNITFGNPISIQGVNALFDSNDMETFHDVLDDIEASDDPASLVDKYYDRIATHEGADFVFNDEELSLDIIDNTISKNLTSLSKLGNILTTLKTANKATTDYDPTDVSHLLDSFRLDNRGSLVEDGSLVTKINELIEQAKNQIIGGESMFSDEESARQVVLQAEARIAQIDTLYRIVNTDKGPSVQGEASLIANFRARKAGISDRAGRSSLEILGIDASIKGGKFYNLFNKTAVNPLEFYLLSNKDSKLLTPEEKIQLDKHKKTLGGMLAAREKLLKIVESGNTLVETAQANKKVENIEAIRKRDLAASIKESANIITAVIDDLDFTTDDDFKEFLAWAANASPSDISDESLIRGAQILMRTKKLLNDKMTDQNRLDIIEALRNNKDIKNHHIKDFISNTNVFLNNLSKLLNDENNKVPIAEQINAASLVFSNLVTNLDSETVDKLELAKHPEFADLSNLVIVNGTQGSGKTSVVLGYGVKSAQDSQEVILGEGNAKVLLVSNSDGQVNRLVEEAENAGLDIKSINNNKGLSGEVSNDTGYEAVALRDILKNNDNIDDVTTIVFDEIGLNEYNVTADGKPKNIPDAPIMVQVLHYVSEINKKRGPNNQLKIVGLGDNMQNVHPEGTLLDTEAVLRSSYLTTNHRSNIASLTTALKNINNLGRVMSQSGSGKRLSTTHGPIQGRDDGLLGGVDYTVNKDPFNNQEIADNIREQIELRKNAGSDEFSVALLLDDISDFDSNSVMGKLKEEFPDNINIKIANHTEFQGSEADYVVVKIKKRKGEGEIAYFSRVATSVGRARYFALVSDESTDTGLTAVSNKVDTITISNVADASAAMRPLLINMYADNSQGGAGANPNSKPNPSEPKPKNPKNPKPAGPKPAGPKPKPSPAKPSPPKPVFKTFQEALDSLDESLYSDLLYYASDKVKSANYNSFEDKESAVHRDVKAKYPNDYEELVNAHNAKAILLDVSSTPQEIIAARITLMYPVYNNYKELYDNVVTIVNSIEAGKAIEQSAFTDIVIAEYKYYQENDVKQPLLLPKNTNTSLYSKDYTKGADKAMGQIKKNKKARDKKAAKDKKLKKTPKKSNKDEVKDSLEDLLIKNNKSSNAGDSSKRSSKNMKALESLTSTSTKDDARAVMSAIEAAGFVTVYGNKTSSNLKPGISLDISILKEIGYEPSSLETRGEAYKNTKAAALYPDSDKGITYELVGKIGKNNNGRDVQDLIIVAKKDGKHVILGGVYGYNAMDFTSESSKQFKTAYENAASKAASDKSNKGGYFKIKITNPRNFLSLVTPGSIKSQKEDESLSDFRARNIPLGDSTTMKYQDRLDNPGVYYSEDIIISTQSHIEVDGVSVENPYAGEAFILYSHNKSKVDKKAVAAMMKNGLPLNDEEGLKGLKGGVGMIRLDSTASSFSDIYNTISEVTPSEASKLIEVVTDTFMQEKLANAFADLGTIFVDINNNRQPMDTVREMLDLGSEEGNTFDGVDKMIKDEIKAIDEVNPELGNVLYDIMGGMVMDGMLGSVVEGKVVKTKFGERPMVTNDGNNPLTVVKLDEEDFHLRFDVSKLFDIVEDVVRNKLNISESDVFDALDGLLKMSNQFNEGIKVKPIIADRFNSSNVTVSTAIKFPGIENNLSIRVESIDASSIRLRSTELVDLLNGYTNSKPKTKPKTKPTTKPASKTELVYDALLSKLDSVKDIKDLDEFINELDLANKNESISNTAYYSILDKLTDIEEGLNNDQDPDPAPSSDIAIADVQVRANDVARRIERTIPFLLDLNDLNGEFTPSSIGTDTTTDTRRQQELDNKLEDLEKERTALREKDGTVPDKNLAAFKDLSLRVSQAKGAALGEQNEGNIPLRTETKEGEDATFLTKEQVVLADKAVQEIIDNGLKRGLSAQEIVNKISSRHTFYTNELGAIQRYVTGLVNNETEQGNSKQSFAAWRRGEMDSGLSTTTDTTTSISEELDFIKSELEDFEIIGVDIRSVSDTITNAIESATRAVTANSEDVRKRINDSLEKEYSIEELTGLPENLLTKYHVAKANKDFELADSIKEEITQKYFDVGPSSDPSIEEANRIKNTPETSIEDAKSNIKSIKDMLSEGKITDATYNEIFNIIKDRLVNTKEADNLKKLISEGKSKDIDVSKVVNKDIGTLIEGSRDENISDTISDEARSIIEGSWVELENLVSLKEGASNASIPTKEEMDIIINNSEAKFSSYVGFVADPAKVLALNEEFDAIKENAVAAVLKARNTMSKNTPEPNTEASINNLTPEFYNPDLEVKLSASDKEVINGLDDGLKKITANYLNAKGESADMTDVFIHLSENLTPEQYNNVTKYLQEKHNDSTCR